MLNEEFRRMQKIAGIITESKFINEVVEVPSWLKDKLEDVHVKPGQGSIFSKSVDEILKLAQNLLDKTNPKELDKIANSIGTLTMNVPNVGYNLVLPIEQAKKLPGAQTSKVEKQEGPNKIKVPAIITSAPLSQFSTNKLTVIVRPKKDESGAVIPNEYIVLSIFPGDPDIPRASEWNDKYAVIIPNQVKNKTNENISCISKPDFKNIIREMDTFDLRTYLANNPLLNEAKDLSPEEIEQQFLKKIQSIPSPIVGGEVKLDPKIKDKIKKSIEEGNQLTEEQLNEIIDPVTIATLVIGLPGLIKTLKWIAQAVGWLFKLNKGNENAVSRALGKAEHWLEKKYLSLIIKGIRTAYPIYLGETDENMEILAKKIYLGMLTAALIASGWAAAKAAHGVLVAAGEGVHATITATDIAAVGKQLADKI